MNTSLQTALVQKALILSVLPSAVWLGVPFGNLPTAVTAMLMPAAQAQQLDPQERHDFLADPLEAPPDPLLPVLAVERALSPLELRAIADGLDERQRRAEALLLTGDTQQAFDLLLQEVRLRRLFGLDAELEAIERVAALAWQQQRSVTIQLLTLRTREIWNAAQTDLGVEPEAVLGGVDSGRPEDSPISGVPSADERALTTLARIFTTLRDIDSTVEVYQQLIAVKQSTSEATTTQKIALAELNLGWFKFAEAANVYLDLLAQAREDGETAREIFYLERLVYSYQQAESLPNALRSQTDLLNRYLARGEEEKLPNLLVAIAQNYQTIGQSNNAIKYYRSAYAAAQQLEQYSFSAKALQELGKLYKTVDSLNEALISYNLLVLVERQAYNDYGIMNAYDELGQIYRQQGELAEALKRFQQGLVLADRLSLRVDYFTEQIEAVSQELSERDTTNG